MSRRRHTYSILSIARRHPQCFSRLFEGTPVKMNDCTPTTRRYSRTAGEAFKDASYANPIEPPETRNGWGGVLLAIAIGLVGACILIVWGAT